MDYRYTDGRDKDFIALCHELDQFLNEIAGGQEERAQYIPYNSLDDIHDVIVVYEEGTPVGCAAFKKYDAECAEMKRVFIRTEYRGRGLADILMEQLEKKAKENGYRYLILESGEPLTAAMGLYKKRGYQTIPNYEQYKDMPESVCMKKSL